MHKTKQHKKKEPPQDKMYVVHPQCRGYIHRTTFYSTLYKQQFLSAHSVAGLLNNPKTTHLAANSFSDLRTQLQMFSAPLSYALFLQHLSYKNPLRTQLQRSSMHSAGT